MIRSQSSAKASVQACGSDLDAVRAGGFDLGKLPRSRRHAALAQSPRAALGLLLPITAPLPCGEASKLAVMVATLKTASAAFEGSTGLCHLIFALGKAGVGFVAERARQRLNNSASLRR